MGIQTFWLKACAQQYIEHCCAGSQTTALLRATYSWYPVWAASPWYPFSHYMATFGPSASTSLLTRYAWTHPRAHAHRHATCAHRRSQDNEQMQATVNAKPRPLTTSSRSQSGSCCPKSSASLTSHLPVEKKGPPRASEPTRVSARPTFGDYPDNNDAMHTRGKYKMDFFFGFWWFLVWG